LTPFLQSVRLPPSAHFPNKAYQTKAKEKVNKSKAVRDYVAANPKATNKEVSEALTKKGIAVTPNHVANIKSKSKPKRKAAERMAKEAVAPNHHVFVPEIKAALCLLKLTGGVKEANAAVAVAHEIRQMV
jgi:hypothetical protein